MQFDGRRFTLKLAETKEEILASQRLRYRVFVKEMGARVDGESERMGIERDSFDPFFDHLILLDNAHEDPGEAVIGTYRLLRGEVAAEGPGFYGSSEFDLERIAKAGRRSVELGRSCVDARYRGGPAMLLLWNGLADYVLSRDIEIMFGVASFPGVDPDPIEHALSYLYHNHLAPSDIRVRVHEDCATPMNTRPLETTNRSAALAQMPALIKGYLRLGGFVGEGAYIDHGFNTVDVCLILDTARMSAKHKAHYVRGYTR